MKRDVSIHVMKRLLILTLFLVTVLSFPIHAQAQSGTVFVFTTSYSLDHGVLVSGDITKLNIEDGNSLILTETKSLFTGEQEITPLPTEDNADKWYISGNFESLDNVTTGPLVGSYCLEMVANGTGIAKLLFDNGTANAMNYIAIDSAFFNFSLRAETARFVLTEIRAYETEANYAYILPSLIIGTGWQTYSITRSDMKFVNLQLGDPINWLEFTFTVQTGGIGKSVFYDGGGFYGVEPDAVLRLGSGEFIISNIPQGYDNYVLNITATHYLNTTINDAFLTEDYNDWNATAGVTLSDDSDNAIHGTNALKAIIDVSQGNATVTFDNQTGNNMQLDFSAYDRMEYHLWGNTTFVVDAAHMHTDENNYFFVDVDITYDDDNSTVSIPLGLFTEYGNPTLENISYFEVLFSNITNTQDFQLWFDGFYFEDSDRFIFTTDCDTEETFESTHSHDGEGEIHVHWATTEITLNYTKLISEGFVLTTSINDTKAAFDEFNTSILIDAFYITAWMNSTTISPLNIFSELFLSLEMWGYLGPMMLVVVGYVLAKKETMLGVLWFIVECLFVARYLELVEATPDYWWHILIILMGGLFTCIFPAVLKQR